MVKRNIKVANLPPLVSRKTPPRKGTKKLGMDDMDTIRP